MYVCMYYVCMYVSTTVLVTTKLTHKDRHRCKFFFFFLVHSYISRVHHEGEIFAYVTVFFLIQPLR